MKHVEKGRLQLWPARFQTGDCEPDICHAIRLHRLSANRYQVCADQALLFHVDQMLQQTVLLIKMLKVAIVYRQDSLIRQSSNFLQCLADKLLIDHTNFTFRRRSISGAGIS